MSWFWDWSFVNFASWSSIVGVLLAFWAAVASTWSLRRVFEVERIFSFQINIEKRKETVNFTEKLLKSYIEKEISPNQYDLLILSNIEKLIVECGHIEKFGNKETRSIAKEIVKKSKKIVGKKFDSKELLMFTAKLSALAHGLRIEEERFKSGNVK